MSDTPDLLIVGVDNRIELQSLYDTDTAAYINDATVTHTLYDADGAIVDGESERACAYVVDSDGTYRATIPVTAPIEPERAYRGIYTAVSGPKTYLFRVDYLAIFPAL